MCAIPAAYAAYAAYAAVGLAAYGAYTASETRKDTADYQAAVNRNNATVAERQAADAKERGDVAAAATRRKYAALQGTQAAALAARGLDISEGSANAILTDTDFFGDYDQRIVKANAGREAWGYQVQASNMSSNAAFLQAQADAENPLLSAGLAGGQSYLSYQATQVKPSWYGKPAGVDAYGYPGG